MTAFLKHHSLIFIFIFFSLLFSCEKENHQDSDTDIVSLNSPIDDAVHALCFNTLDDKQLIKSFCVLAAGDIHGDEKRMHRMIQYLNSKDVIDCGVMLGDIVSNNFNNDATFYTQAISKANKPFLTIIGNHDAGSSNSAYTSYSHISDLVEKFITPNVKYADLAKEEYSNGVSYYYKDFSPYNIRMICLNQFEYPDSDANGKTEFEYRRGFAFYSQAQIDWFIQVLSNTPSNYHVIIALHYVPDYMIGEDHLFTSEKFVGKRLKLYQTVSEGDFINGHIITDIVDAWIYGKRLENTYTVNIPSVLTEYRVSADFSSRGFGSFICYIGGHWHNSIISHCIEYPNQKEYSVDIAGLYVSETDTPRKEGTRSEDSFVLLGFDTNRKRVNILRIGAHYTQGMTDRLLTSFSY